jgi:hypothetical protein
VRETDRDLWIEPRIQTPIIQIMQQISEEATSGSHKFSSIPGLFIFLDVPL